MQYCNPNSGVNKNNPNLLITDFENAKQKFMSYCSESTIFIKCYFPKKSKPYEEFIQFFDNLIQEVRSNTNSKDLQAIRRALSAQNPVFFDLLINLNFSQKKKQIKLQKNYLNVRCYVVKEG